MSTYNHPANGTLSNARIVRVIEDLQCSLTYQNGGDMAYIIADVIKGLNELQACRHAHCDYRAAIELLRQRAATELDRGYNTHHNALIYAANELENAQAFGQEVSHES